MLFFYLLAFKTKKKTLLNAKKGIHNTEMHSNIQNDSF